MNILVACEESQAVCKAFREKGHCAFSCDLFLCSGGHPEWHYQGDMFDIIANRGGTLQTGKIFLGWRLGYYDCPSTLYLSFGQWS